MAKIFKVSSELKVPVFSGRDMQQYENNCGKFKADLKSLLLKRSPNGKNVGEVISFPVADSYAEYMVANTSPAELVHLPLGDGWDFEYAHKLNAKDIQQKVDQRKAIKKLFS